MPPKMVKRGRPKGAEITVNGLPSKKKTKLVNKTQNVVTTFSKLRPTEKDRLILKCFAKPSVGFNTVNGTKLIEGDDITKDVAHLSGDAQDEKNFDIQKIEKYFQQSAWLPILEMLEKKQKCKWCCNSYQKTIRKENKVLHVKDVSYGCI